ncbi:MAG: lysine--tRNA ligase [Candidatus Peribacteraceae bacterium]|nr:lysine--tRNA ligase [Candidatus Peribacteraceae bacterium]
MDSVRLKKAGQIRLLGGLPYASTFPRTHKLAEVKDLADGTPASVAGRVMLKREMGKMTFMTLQDLSGRMQIALRANEVGEEKYDQALSLIDLGDIIGVHGERFTTQKGEPTVLVKEWTMLTKALRQPPEKWHGIADQETAWRQRYLDLLSNRETLERFRKRSLFLRLLREFYWSREFIEVETPTLVNAASGALATPFQTHHNAYDMDVFLRIAPETFLKECLIGGFDRVFEVARCFRNEGLDPSHLQDFTMVEHYAAYWDYTHNMTFTEELLTTVLKEMVGTLELEIPDRDGNLKKVDFTPPWPRLSIREAVKKASGIDIEDANSKGALLEAISKQGITLDVAMDQLGYGSLVDQLYKKVSRPSIVQPTFLVEHPIELSPLARRNDFNPRLTDRFQLVVGGWEVVNAYSELVDPVDQAERFEAQAKASGDGDAEAHRKDDDYVKALEYGCPPSSGWGMGVDRIVALLTQQKNIRDVVLFPLMKPLRPEEEDNSEGALHEAEKKKPTKPRNPKSTQQQQSSVSSDSSVSSVSSLNTLINSPPTLLPQNAEYGHLLPAAHGLLEKHADKTKEHLIATGAVMESLAARFGGDPQTWKVAGMLHDLDWDHLEKDAEKHCGTTLEQLLATIEAPQELLADIRSHYAEKYGAEHPLDTWLRKALYCADELTGFIIAVALVRPSRKLADVEVKSVKKKLKDKSFAAQVNREQILRCETLLGIPLDEFIGLNLEAMKKVAAEIGL